MANDNKITSRTKFNVIYLGWRECPGLRGVDMTEPIIRDTLNRHRSTTHITDDLPQLTITVTKKELRMKQIIVRESKPGRIITKLDKIKFQSIRMKSVTFVARGLHNYAAVVACIYAGFNPGTSYYSHVQVYLFESDVLAEAFERHLHHYIDAPAHHERVLRLELEMIRKGQISVSQENYVYDNPSASGCATPLSYTASLPAVLVTDGDVSVDSSGKPVENKKGEIYEQHVANGFLRHEPDLQLKLSSDSGKSPMRQEFVHDMTSNQYREYLRSSNPESYSKVSPHLAYRKSELEIVAAGKPRNILKNNAPAMRLTSEDREAKQILTEDRSTELIKDGEPEKDYDDDDDHTASTGHIVPGQITPSHLSIGQVAHVQFSPSHLDRSTGQTAHGQLTPSQFSTGQNAHEQLTPPYLAAGQIVRSQITPSHLIKDQISHGQETLPNPNDSSLIHTSLIPPEQLITEVNQEDELIAVTLATELKNKLGRGPILLPPKDYDTVNRSHGTLLGIEQRKCLNEKIVGKDGGYENDIEEAGGKVAGLAAFFSVR